VPAADVIAALNKLGPAAPTATPPITPFDTPSATSDHGIVLFFIFKPSYLSFIVNPNVSCGFFVHFVVLVLVFLFVDFNGFDQLNVVHLHV
jgi:hypothetical protein